jgi:phosphoglucosamine mutase
MMNETRKLFGTDGIRGKANIFPMTGEVAMALGRAVTFYFQKNNQKKPLIIIGKDTRLSCYMLEQAFSAGVCSQGGRAILTGPLPTPGVAFVTQSMRADAGVMISASHNAFEDNGIKIFDRSGHKLPDEVEAELEKMILNPEMIPQKEGAELGRAKRLDEVIGRYIVQAKSAFSHEYTLEGLRIVVDGAHGAAYKLAPIVFDEMGAEVISIGNKPDGKNINRDCGALHPEMCQEQVRQFRADLGICLDGDADRVVIIGPSGDVIPGDQLIGLMARFLLEKKEIQPKSEIVGTVMTNLGLEKYLNSLDLSLTRTKVGDRYIVERMIKSGALFGGEPSGHLIFKKYSTSGDGILAGLKVLECLQFFNKDLSELLAPIELYPQIIKNIKVKERIPLDRMPKVQEEILRAEGLLKNQGRVLVRYSGTEPLIRVMVEGKKESLVKKIGDEIVAVIEKEFESL